MWFKSECDKISDRLWDYSARRLSMAETAQVESHLLQCARCQAESEAYRQTVEILGAARHLPVPASQTTWRDLRPALAPVRRPALRSADLLPRLTLAGAGTALAATLVVVFLSGGHRSTSFDNSALGTSDRNRVASSGPATSSPVATNVPTANMDQGMGDVASGLTLGSFLNSAFALLPTPSAVERPRSAPAPELPTPRHRNYNHYARLASGNGHIKTVVTSEDAEAQLDGGNVSPRAQQNYVLSPVSATADDETAHRYVIGSIPVSQSGGGMVASSDGTEEGRAW